MPEPRIAVVGLGYVGLPVAIAFGKVIPTLGFDISPNRIQELKNGHDKNRECSPSEILGAGLLEVTNLEELLDNVSIFIVTVPTPIDKSKNPNLSSLVEATNLVAHYLKPGSLVIFESTVYPGCTEEVCIPILESISGLILNIDFHVGYSPERINPGDKDNRFASVLKVTSGSDDYAAGVVSDLYRQVVSAGVFQAKSIRVAEASKVIENIQRDVNIALMNELAMLFGKLEIDSSAVFEAARTKWNFVDFQPGLVGGHCISVDPYYLAFQARRHGIEPKLFVAGRSINEQLPAQLAQEFVSLMKRKGLAVDGAKILVLGLSYKENVPDVRDTKVIPLVKFLNSLGVFCAVIDPMVDKQWASLLPEGNNLFTSLEDLNCKDFSGAILAVGHSVFQAYTTSQLRRKMRPKAVIYDLKNFYPKGQVDGGL